MVTPNVVKKNLLNSPEIKIIVDEIDSFLINKIDKIFKDYIVVDIEYFCPIDLYDTIIFLYTHSGWSKVKICPNNHVTSDNRSIIFNKGTRIILYF